MIKIELPKITGNKIQILDMNGKIVDEFISNELYLQVDVLNLESGVYLLKFDFDGQQIMKRIIVQK